jgi:hypothetical protein
MGVPTSEVGYTSATTWRGVHEVYKGYVVALGKNFDVYLNYVTYVKLRFLPHRPSKVYAS